MKTTMTKNAHVVALKDHPAYVAEREARLTQIAVETPDCWVLTCFDCCYTERVEKRAPECPECGSRCAIRRIRNGVVDA